MDSKLWSLDYKSIRTFHRVAVLRRYVAKILH